MPVILSDGIVLVDGGESLDFALFSGFTSDDLIQYLTYYQIHFLLEFMKRLPRFSLGIGDRFGRQGLAQLRAFIKLREQTGVVVAPVWNKSNREHIFMGTHPQSVRLEADITVQALDWNLPYFVDADHVAQQNVEKFISSSDFFTLDVAEFMGRPSSDLEIEDFMARHAYLLSPVEIEGLESPITLTKEHLRVYLNVTLAAIREAGKLYRYIRGVKGHDDFVVEISVDETVTPQQPALLLVILAAIGEERIPVQVLAPKFSGRLKKGMDYAGDPQVFARQLDANICLLRDAISRYDLPDSLKLSVHYGSDKFSLYPFITDALRRHHTGIHIKTAGTTWLAEVVGLALSGGEGLAIAKELYGRALLQFDFLCQPYQASLEIDTARLPTAEMVSQWTSEQFARALRHVPEDPLFNGNFRQFMHVAYKIAAKMGPRFTVQLEANQEWIEPEVMANLYDHHLLPIFGSLGQMEA